MKHQITGVLLLSAFLVFTACTNPISAQKNQAKEQVLVYYFHNTHRCPTCIAIEKHVRKTLDTHYQKKMQKGIMKLSVMDIGEKANKTLVEKYQVYGSTLLITTITDGKEDVANMTSFAFANARNESKFIAGLKEKIDESFK